MSAAERSRDAAETTREAHPPSSLVPRRRDRELSDAERLMAAVAALERVRTQLARTQRTLDAFLAQVTNTPDGARTRSSLPAAPEPLPEPAPAAPKAPVSTDPSRSAPPSVLADHVLPPAERQPPPAPVIARAPMAPTVAAEPPEPPAPRPAPPGALADHVHAPGGRPAPVVAQDGAPASETAAGPRADSAAPTDRSAR